MICMMYKYGYYWVSQAGYRTAKERELTSQNCPPPSAYVLLPPELTGMYQHTQLENISTV